MEMFQFNDKDSAANMDQELNYFLDEPLYSTSFADLDQEIKMEESVNDLADNWIDSLISEHPVLNDCMLSDPLQLNPFVHSEHSYSAAGNGSQGNSEKALDMSIHKSLEIEMLETSVNPNKIMSTGSTTQADLSGGKTIKIEPDSSKDYINVTDTDDVSVDDHQKLNIKQESPYKFKPIEDSMLSTGSSLLLSPSKRDEGKYSGINHRYVSDSCSSHNAVTKNTVISTSNTTRVVTVPRTMNPQTLLKPTFILATQNNSDKIAVSTTNSHSTLTGKQERYVLPKVNIKVEPGCFKSIETGELKGFDQVSLPPTPPSSSNSDSDGCQSPERSQPSSPCRSSRNYHHSYSLNQLRNSSPSPTNCAPFFMNPIPTSGVLILTEEEKRTLISEGYPIPTKLPLTKTEEKNLKKIRRKIKNKISAQESRRKKKDYLESLEKKVESYSQENIDLKRKMDSLESNNRSLISQLQKLQSIVNKIRPQNTSQTGTCLMVLVLCFALFFGAWTPTWSIGYTNINSSNSYIQAKGSKISCYAGENDKAVKAAAVAAAPMIADLETFESKYKQSVAHSEYLDEHMDERYYSDTKDDPYGPATIKSRVLLSMKEEEMDQENEFAWTNSYFCFWKIKNYFLAKLTGSVGETVVKQYDDNLAAEPLVVVKVVETGNNETALDSIAAEVNLMLSNKIDDQETMHPSIEVVAPVQIDAAS